MNGQDSLFHTPEHAVNFSHGPHEVAQSLFLSA